MATTSVAPIVIPQINSYYYVGEAMVRTIQEAVTLAVSIGPGLVIIPQEYDGTDSIAAVTGGSALVYIIDERGGDRQTYVWWNGVYIMQPFNAKGGLVSPKLNHYLYVGVGTNPTMQAAIDSLAGYATLHFVIIISPSYTGSEVIGNLTGGNANMVVSDQRADQWQLYHWSGTQFVPSDLELLGDLTVDTISANVIAANDAEFDECTVENSPVRTFSNTPDAPGPSYPPAGIGVSTGTSWNPTSIDPATLPRLNTPNTFTAPQTINAAFTVGVPPAATIDTAGTLNINGTLTVAASVRMGLRGSGVPWQSGEPNINSDGTNVFLNPTGAGEIYLNWDMGARGVVFGNGAATPVASIDNAGDFIGNTIHVTGASGLALTPNTAWMDVYGGNGRIITVGPSAGLLTGFTFAGIDGAGGDYTQFLNMGANGLTTTALNITNLNSSAGTVITALLMTPNMGNGGNNSIYIGQSNTPGNCATMGFNFFGNGSSLNRGVIGIAGGAAAVFDPIGDWAFASNINVVGQINTGSLVIGGVGPQFFWDGGSAFIEGAPNGRLLINAHSGNNSVCQVTGTFEVSGGPKTFRILHPLDDTKDLVHACLEGPENGVFYRGEGTTRKGVATITLPDYFEALTSKENRTIQLTERCGDGDEPEFGNFLAANRIEDGKFNVRSTSASVKFYWEVKAVRGDISPLKVETAKGPRFDKIQRPVVKPLEALTKKETPSNVRPRQTDAGAVRSGTPKAGKPKPKTVRAGNSVATGYGRTRKTH